MEISKSFTRGIMNKDLDDRLIPDGVYRDALNIKVSSSDDQDSGTVQNYFGNASVIDVNTLLTAAGFTSQGNNLFPIGSFVDSKKNAIYWFITSPTYDIIARYIENEAGDPFGDLVLVETRSTGMMNFTREYLITGVNIVENLLFFTDGLNPPRRINVDKTYRDATISDDSVNVIVKPPIASPEVELVYDATVPENPIDDKFIRFSYRYRYANNEISAMSPFSKTAFEAQTFKFNFNTGRNESMRNKANSVNVTVDLGSSEVTKVEILMKDSRNTNVAIVTSIDKSTVPTGATTFTYNFKNDKVYAVLPNSQVTRLFDNVPLAARAQDLIGSRVVYGNYKQFFDIKKASGEDIIMDFNVAKKSSATVSGQPNETFKSGRSYEVGVAYLDDYGRMTTVLESSDNTAIIPITDATTKNQLEVTIKNRPPAFASKYRFFIKQNRGSYYNMLPISFYKVGSFIYFQIEKYDIDKVTTGDYIYIKSSPSGLSGGTTKYKVIEAEQKKENFLGTQSREKQEEGFYLKVDIGNSNIFSDSGFLTILNSNTGSTERGGAVFSSGIPDPLDRYIAHVDNPIFYGSGFSSLSVDNTSSLYNSNTDKRLYVEVTASNKFRYREFDKSNWIQEDVTMSPSGNVLVVSTGASTLNVAKVYFTTSASYTVGDSWRINYRGNVASIFGSPIKATRSDKKDGAFAIVSNINAGANMFDTTITPGTILYFTINDGYDQPEQRFISSGTYANIEEWFFEENIYSEFSQIMPDGRSDGSKTVFFRKSTGIWQKDGVNYLNDVGNQTGFVSMVIRSYQEASGSTSTDTSKKFIKFSLRSKKPLGPTILETEGVQNSDAIYYEIPKTYPIVNGLHKKILATDQDQIGATPARITLEEFNAITFGNGMESSVIEDDWNGPQLLPSPRASAAIDRYQQVIADNFLTYSGVFNESSSTNNLNEFNLSLANFKQLDKEFGPVQKLHARAGDLLVFQEDKISKVLFGKNLLVDAVGGGTVTSIPEVLGTQIPYVADFGISNNPESFAKWSSDIYFTDQKRGAVLSISGDSISVISSSGMKNFFRDLFDANPNKQKLGAYDPFEFKYVLTTNDTDVEKCELSVTNDEIFVSGDAFANGFLFSIKSNSSWSISVSNGSWLTLNATSGRGDRVITGTATSNLGGVASRTATFTITYCNGLVKTLTLTQSNESKKQTVVVTVGDSNDAGKMALPSYRYGPSDVEGIKMPIGIGDYSFVDMSPDFVGQGAIPDVGDTVSIVGNTSFVGADSLPQKPFNPALGDKMYYLDTNTKYDVAQGDDMILAATEVTPSLVSGEYIGNFTYDALGDYLYLIIDYRNRVNNSSTITSAPAPLNNLPEAIVINNSSSIGNYTVTYSSDSSDIRFTVENSSGAIVVDSGYVSSPSSQVFTIKKTTSGSDTIKVYNRDFTGSPVYTLVIGAVGLTSASISDDGYTTTALACASSSTQTIYHNGGAAAPSFGDTIYTDTAGLLPLAGNDEFYKSGTNALRINAFGVVTSIVSCICGESNAPVVEQVSINVVQNQDVSFTIQATNNPISYAVEGNCREFSLFGGDGGAVFAGDDCKTGLEKQVFVSTNETIERCFFLDSVYKVAGASNATFEDIGGCAQSLPDGLTFEPLTGVISGTPTVSGNFTFTVTATNCAGTSAPVEFDITVQPDVAPNKEFYIDNTNSQSTSAAACSLSATYTMMYHDGILSYPVIRDIVYEDETGLNLFAGEDLWYKMQNGVVVKIGDDGVVDDTFLCNINPPAPSIGTAVSLAPGASSSLSCASTSFATFYYTGSIGVNPGKLYSDAGATAFAPAAWYKYEVEAGVFISLEWDGLQWTGSADCA